MSEYNFYKNKQYDKIINDKGIKQRKKKIFSSIVAPFPSYTMDIFHLSNKARGLKDKGATYILALIETTSRYVIIYIVKKSKPKDRVNFEELKPIFEDFIGKYKPLNLTSDAEKAFISKETQALFKEHNIKHYIHNVLQTGKHTPLSLIDRFLRTFRQLIYKYVNINNKFIEEDETLFKLIDTYNNSPHSSLPRYVFNEKTNKNGTIHSYFKNYSPYQVFNNKRLQDITRSNALSKKNNNLLEKLQKLKAGDKVRVSVGKKTGEKGGMKWSDKVYTIYKFNGYTYELLENDNKYSFNQLLKIN